MNVASVLLVFFANAATISESHMAITEGFFFLLMEKYMGSAGLSVSGNISVFMLQVLKLPKSTYLHMEVT